MAIIKISELPAADSPVSPSDVAPFLQNGVTKKAAIDQLGFVSAGTNAVTRTIQGKLRERISVVDFGVLPGSANAIPNCNAYANLAAYVNSIGGNCEIVWPSAQDAYEFTPYLNPTYNATPNLWRGVVELVNVKNCYHVGFGATVKFNMNPTWYRGNPNVATLDESVFQFRASGSQGNCDHVGVRGLRIEATATLPAGGGLGYSDGSALGVAYRGCTNTLTENVTCRLWGTDGLYFGAAYGNAFGGFGHTVINPVMIANYRQGISIVWNSDGTIVGGEIRDTGGSSFGHAIDWEPDASNTQSNWTVINLKTRNNERGAFNFINTSNVRIINADVEEKAATAVGAIYIDGSNVAGYNVKEIVFDGGKYVALQAVCYVSSVNTANAGITNIRFINGAFLSTTASAPNSASFFRINPFSAGAGFIGDFFIENCVIDGNGGIYFQSGGGGTGRLFITNTKWTVRNTVAAGLSFTLTVVGAEMHWDGVEMSVASGNTISTYTVGGDWRNGTVKNCILSGQSGAIFEWKDWYTGGALKIGYNKFSQYNYYKGPVTALELKAAGSVQLDGFSGDFGLPFRIMNGGRQRVLQYAATPANFLGPQAPVDGDITFNVANSNSSTVNEIFVYDKDIGWQPLAIQTRKGTTAARPSTAIGTALTGQLYLDTTLAAAGKPIFWTGTEWVDATGTVV